MIGAKGFRAREAAANYKRRQRRLVSDDVRLARFANLHGIADESKAPVAAAPVEPVEPVQPETEVTAETQVEQVDEATSADAGDEAAEAEVASDQAASSPAANKGGKGKGKNKNK
jgi:hypothetical protein